MSETRNCKDKLVLVLGATGGVGGATARALLARGYRIRALHRRADEMAARDPAYQWVQGDAMNADDVRAASEGAYAIVHGVNPPGYQRWAELVLPMMDNTIAAARHSGAVILMPGTIYNFGPDAFPLLKEDSPQHPDTVKGAIRVALEHRLEAAAGEGIRVIILRAGDFFGPDAGNNWFAQGLVKPGKPLKALSLPGRAGIGHAWAYLPDVAETFAQLLDKADSLPRFSRFHMAGYFDADGLGMARAIWWAAGDGKTRIKSFPWWMVRLLAPVVPVFRELQEMRYLWNEPLRLDNHALTDLLGTEPNTPLEDAVLTTLKSLGCINRSYQPPRNKALVTAL
ncbi:nucleoside-diphosphate-sugar epimerase [Agrobacterium vitis]|nr:nucleoside-diphosphate-sugar epimerase [Agrobacterium vitis]MBE1439574.1 nucleoside-diphosphate-sugar epimerase [Agrobacterium vitis]